MGIMKHAAQSAANREERVLLENIVKDLNALKQEIRLEPEPSQPIFRAKMSVLDKVFGIMNKYFKENSDNQKVLDSGWEL